MNCNVDIQGFSTNLNNGAEGSFGVDANGDQSYAFVLDYHGSFGSDVTVSFDILFDPGDADFPGFGNLHRLREGWPSRLVYFQLVMIRLQLRIMLTLPFLGPQSKHLPGDIYSLKLWV
jgi:hypothetical protein